MTERRKFHLENLDQLRAELAELGLELPIDEDLSVLADHVKIGSLETPNRFVAHPMEGFDSTDDGTPGELSFRRYERYARGGVGTIWGEATAVMHEARSNAHQLCLYSDNVDAYARMVESTRKAARESNGYEPIMILQLTHSGRYSKPTGVPKPLIAHRSPILDPLHNLADDYPVVTDDYLDRLQDTFVEAAKLAAKAGFDGVDIKACHRYLMSELLASHTRDGKYGGSLENRSRLLRETMQRIRDEVPEVFITTRMNVYDAISHPYGFGVDQNDYKVPCLDEPLELIGQLVELGIPLLNVSIGNPYYNPHFGRPYDRTLIGVEPVQEDPLAGVARIIGITRQVQQAYPDLPIIGTGYTWLRHLMPQVAAGVVKTGGATLIGQGRGMFAYPNSVNDILQKGAMDPHQACITCSGCTQIMRDGTMTGCVIRDSEIYAEQYKLGRRFAMDHLLGHAQRCLDCAYPTCQEKCPASIDIPRFLRAFANRDFAGAYAVLREHNVLPEMCGYVCPSDCQCEAGCVERILEDIPVAIRDIQLVASKIARREGLTGVKLPDEKSGRRVAIVGGGPAGVACAVKLLEMGHHVTIFEKSDRLGGTPEFMIPEHRYYNAADEIDALLKPAFEAGRLETSFGQELGGNLSLATLREKHDAVFLAMGLGASTSLGQADGVLDALNFLQQAKSKSIPAIGGKVAVLGAGNTAMDAAVTAKKLGADDVYVIYRRSFEEMPAWIGEREEAVKAGVHFFVLTQPLGFETNDDGKLTGLRVARTELGAPDDSGRRSPSAIEGTESTLAVDLVIEAMGQNVPASLDQELAALKRTRGGLLQTAENASATSEAGIFAGGDIVNGGTTAVQAIAEGMRAADEIDQFMKERV